MNIGMKAQKDVWKHTSKNAGKHVRSRDERGDVPGWVLITVMSVGIVAALTGLATEELTGILQRALASVSH